MPCVGESVGRAFYQGGGVGNFIVVDKRGCRHVDNGRGGGAHSDVVDIERSVAAGRLVAEGNVDSLPGKLGEAYAHVVERAEMSVRKRVDIERDIRASIGVIAHGGKDAVVEVEIVVVGSCIPEKTHAKGGVGGDGDGLGDNPAIKGTAAAHRL